MVKRKAMSVCAAPASFEPGIDFVVTKIPRLAFEKLPLADPALTTQIYSVGEAMAIGRTFKKCVQKCSRSPVTREPCASARGARDGAE